MSVVVIFLPTFLYGSDSGLLHGLYVQQNTVKVFYVTHLTKTCHSVSKTPKRKRCIGYYARTIDNEFTTLPNEKGNWLMLNFQDHSVIVTKLIISGNPVTLMKGCRVICVFYDYHKFFASEILCEGLESTTGFSSDYCRFLANFLKLDSGSNAPESPKCLDFFVRVAQRARQYLLAVAAFVTPVVRHTSTGLHLCDILNSTAWLFGHVAHFKKPTLKMGNFLLALLIDVFCGLMLVRLIVEPLTVNTPFSKMLLDMAEVVVTTLRDLLHWLMGVPAGLKLNYALNNMLGKFFLYHINLWWMFLVLCKPCLDLAVHMLTWLGCLGLTFQICLLADLLDLVSFHVYCIYVYAARLYSVQLSGLVALWRLFLGRKWNPLRERVDSCKYSNDQLFVGTLAFTILLFLLPTTLMYYVVFATLRLLVLIFRGVLAHFTWLLRAFPAYSTVLWMTRATTVTSSVQVSVCTEISGNGPLYLAVEPVIGSWWSTVVRGVPDSLQRPPPVQWSQLLKHLCTGRLVYPVYIF
ncbi:phosphatidylinositol N-acetylglucosaminyltransferase subunit Q [Schistocerca serialis cubense]|uniref:phosphatidylinositol N-acetylglucosaminyltransferase subunit Q n=1 Tax=Schistocerca serialis cubense TaxID=2023355 RepID=UPI00214F0DFE|nr:phosphatidylinositol N-acetylglucosaminyltransferase subunit Q [Schistocerca serialis cubense]